MLTPRPLKVFLCHSSGDKPAVRELYQKLAAEGWIDPWLDEEKLLPGQEWKNEIPKAVREADVVIICLSKSSVTKEGYVQKEIRFALDIADEKPENTIFLIPARLEECEVPERLSLRQRVDLFDRQGLERLLKSLKVRYNQKTLVDIGEEVAHLEITTKNHDNKSGRARKVSVPAVPERMLPPSDADLSRQTLADIQFVLVRKGPFLIGDVNDPPSVFVDVPYDYWISRFPITNGQYMEFCLATDIPHINSNWEKEFDYPVINIGWKQAQSYCTWLTKKLKANSSFLSSKFISMLAFLDLAISLKTEIPLDRVMRLPKESEWEIAARGRDARAWPWGNEFDSSKCNTFESGIDRITPVGHFSPVGDSPYGCADMSGNIWEWTYNDFDVVNFRREQRASETRKSPILRGGSFESRCEFSTAYYRNANSLEKYVGFRVVIAPLFT